METVPMRAGTQLCDLKQAPKPVKAPSAQTGALQERLRCQAVQQVQRQDGWTAVAGAAPTPPGKPQRRKAAAKVPEQPRSNPGLLHSCQHRFPEPAAPRARWEQPNAARSDPVSSGAGDSGPATAPPAATYTSGLAGTLNCARISSMPEFTLLFFTPSW